MRLAYPVQIAEPMWRIAAASVAVLAGCYGPDYASCQVACASADDCAPGHTCTGAGLCAAPDQATSCEAATVRDAAPDAVSPIGDYVMLFTNRDNGCAFPGWTEGATSNVDVQLRRNAEVVIGEPQGLAAGFLDLWLGTHVFAGAQTDDKLALVLAGDKKMKQGNCEYTFDASFDVTLHGDAMEGELIYRARTNDAPACNTLTGCRTRQSLSGARAPK